MGATLDRAVLGELSGLIAERMGLHFPEERWPDLARGLEAASLELDFEHPDDALCWLRARELTARQIDALASHLTVGETYFFRDPESFEALEREILPPLVASRLETGRTLRLWSAGCCTGEEAYSLALSCLRVLPDPSAWNVSVLATDINRKFLAKAEAGIYSSWSFRGAPDWLRDQFIPCASGKELAVGPLVKSLVRFDYLNLAEDIRPSRHDQTNAMDVIFCRNVLMYLTPEHQRRVVAALHRCLVNGGYLVVNPAEADASLYPMFSQENVGGAILFRKTSQPTRDAPGPEGTRLHGRRPLKGPDSGEGLQTQPASAGFAHVAGSVHGPAVDGRLLDLPATPPTPPTPPAPPAPVAPVAPVERALPSVRPLSSPREDPLMAARSLANQGQLEKALASCQDAIAADRTNPAGHFLCATICHELGRLGEAVVALGRVLYLDQDFILAHHELASIYRQLERPKESRRHLAVALKLLSARTNEELVPESDGMTCGRLLESVRAMAEG